MAENMTDNNQTQQSSDEDQQAIQQSQERNRQNKYWSEATSHNSKWETLLNWPAFLQAQMGKTAATLDLFAPVQEQESC